MRYGALHNKMKAAQAWRDNKTLQRFCAEQLLLGRLALVMGAGVSMATGLPDWNELMRRCCQFEKKEWPKNLDSERAAEWLWSNCCGSDDRVFAKLVRRALYKNYKHSGVSLAKHELLAALAALSFPSARGNVRQIITFNFDDLLEELLRGFGVCVEPVWKLPSWRSRSDVQVYHPHGYLPQNGALEASEGLVLAQKDFDRIVGDTNDLWKSTLLEILSTHTCLFVGLSGADKNLSSLLSLAKGRHVSKGNSHPYWGIRLGDKATAGDEGWKNRGVKVVNFQSYDEVPEFIRKICGFAIENQ